MPFKSDKQRKWMHANEPEMAKKWEKEESLREKIRGIIKRELEATTTSAVPSQNTPTAFKISTQKAIDVDDEDDEDEILGGQRKESVNEGRKWTMYVDDKKIKTHASKRAAVIAYNKFIKDTDDWKEVSIQAESVNEATSSKDFFSGSKVTNSLPRATLSLLNSKLNKASEAIIKITDKYKKQGDIDELVKIWMRGLHLRLKKGGIKIESVNEKVAKPFSEHLRKAQDEIEYMISNGPTPDGDDGVYDKPNQAMKLLQIAQKSLGKIK
jgi:hypothetical protein